MQSTDLTIPEDVKRPAPYTKTYDFTGPFINDHHAFYSTCKKDGINIDIGIPGWLQQADALKLYELAYFCNGDILELGCNRGLSTSILAQAVRDSNKNMMILTNDLGEKNTAQAMQNLKQLGLSKLVSPYVGDAVELCRILRENNRHFGFVFVDHAHTYTSVYEVCETLNTIVLPGGYCLFHDYKDLRNFDASNDEYGVWQGVRDGLSSELFEYLGLCGCCGLYRRRV